MKKYISLLVAFIVLTTNAFTQITTSLVVNQPSATLSEWNNSTITFVVNKMGTMQQQVVIKAELLAADGSVVATKDLTKAPVFTLQEGTRIFFTRDVLPLETAIFTGSFKSTLEKTGMLPSGTYQLNVQLVNTRDFTPITPVQSRLFNLSAPQLPYLILPVNHSVLNAKKSETSIIFRWTPLIPKPQEQPFYRLQVFEILPYQQPLQALRGNQPLLDQFVRGQTQYIWRPQLPFSTDTLAKRFIWTIQSLNSNRQPVIQTSGNGESRSEPFIFIISGAGSLM